MYSKQSKTAKASAHNSDTPAKSHFASRRFLVQKPVPQTPQNPDVQAQSARVEQSGQGINPNIFKYHPPRQPRGIQMKLSIGEPGDKYEQEADKVAADVVQRINAPESEEVQRMEVPEEEELQMKPAVDSIQRMEVPEEEELQMKPAVNSIQRMEVPEEEELQMKPAVNSIQRMDVPEEEELQMKPAVNSIQRMDVPEEEELQMKPEITSLQRQEEPEEELQAKSILQRQEAIGGGEASTDLDTAINSARGSGQEMADNIRQPMEQAFGADFSGVKVHTDGQSDQLNQSIQARAFTTGQDVFFRQGEYNPGSRGGQELLAHELTHVVQQNGVTVQRYPQLQAKTNDLSLTKFKDSQSPFTSQSIHPFTRTEAVIQRVVTLDMLEAQRVNIEQEGTYNSTIDEDTSTTQANAVGEQWVGEHHDRGLYGPPHNYRLISQNGRRQYRPPMTKQGGKKIGQVQANFEWRRPDEENFCFNAHVTVVDAAT